MTEKGLESIKLRRTERFINSLIDSILFLVTFIVLIMFSFVFSINPETLEASHPFIINYVIPYLLMILFYFIQEYLLRGRTIGKIVTGSIAVDNQGNIVDIKKSFYRSICRLIPFDSLSFLRESKRGFHDTVTDTYVVNKKKWEEMKNNPIDLIDQIGIENEIK